MIKIRVFFKKGAPWLLGREKQTFSFIVPLERALAAFDFCRILFTMSAQTVWSCRTPIFHRVIRVKEWGLGYHVHGHSVNSRFSAEAQCVPRGLPHSAKVEKQLCEDYRSPITTNVTASAPLSLIMSMGKHTGRVYRLRNQDLKRWRLLLSLASREIKTY